MRSFQFYCKYALISVSLFKSFQFGYLYRKLQNRNCRSSMRKSRIKYAFDHLKSLIRNYGGKTSCNLGCLWFRSNSTVRSRNWWAQTYCVHQSITYIDRNFKEIFADWARSARLRFGYWTFARLLVWLRVHLNHRQQASSYYAQSALDQKFTTAYSTLSLEIAPVYFSYSAYRR